MKLMKSNPVKTRQKFDEMFKRSAIQNWLSSGKSAEVVAEELGIKQDRLYAWKKRFAPLSPDESKPASLGRFKTSHPEVVFS